jgi:rubrerythrin
MARIVADRTGYANLAAYQRVEQGMAAKAQIEREDLVPRSGREFACRRCGYGITVFVSRLPRCPVCGAASWRERLRRWRG